MENQSNGALNLLLTVLFGVAGVLIIFIFVALRAVSFGESPQSSTTVANASPIIVNVTISPVSCNPTQNITLTESTTASTDYYVCGLINDSNGCSDIEDNFGSIAFYKTGNTCEDSGDVDDDTCIWMDTTADPVDCTWGTHGLPCNPGGVSVDFTCKLKNLYYFIDPGEWTGTVSIKDDANQTGSGSGTTTVNTLLALNLAQGVIDYGTLSVNETSTDKTLGVANSGNSVVDLMLSGTSMTCNGLGAIAPAKQKFSTSTAVAYADKQTLADTNATTTIGDFDLVAQSVSTSASIKNLYWQIHVPASGVLGQCTGVNYIVANPNAP